LQRTPKATDDKTKSPFNVGLCLGYIDGVIDRNDLAYVHKSVVCVPSDVTNGQEEQIVMKYLNDHPERLHYAAALLVLEAMHQAFPCQDTQKK
jgi:Rap1a immunity proteins